MLTYTGLRKAAAWSVAGTAALALAVVVFAPASAQSVLQRLTALTCNDPQSCLSIINTSPKGKAIVGVAQNAPAIVGRININTNTNPNPPVKDDFLNGGVRGDDVSTNPLDTNAGVLGITKNGEGVAGLTTCDRCPFGSIGVLGADLSSTVNSNGGVVGISNHNAGLVAQSFDPNTGVGVVGQDDGGLGVLGLSLSPTIGGVAVFGFTTLGNGGQFQSGDAAFAALAIDNTGTGPIIHAFGGTKEVMSLDNAGNMVLAGNIQTGGTPMSISSTSGGRHVVTYAARQSVPTMEDVGEAQLVHGQAVVKLEPTFASAMNARTTYLVFITPQGDTNGFLYVTQKTAAGFVVREHNGASNIAFDYRIVAQPYGSVATRMPLYVEPRNAAVQTAETRRMLQLLSRKRPHIR